MYKVQITKVGNQRKHKKFIMPNIYFFTRYNLFLHRIAKIFQKSFHIIIWQESRVFKFPKIVVEK